ncbi:Importin 9 [Gonapodya sp. JEL0774]|nr:Importin 9 [Gonapodya sp. JEL0774]
MEVVGLTCPNQSTISIKPLSQPVPEVQSSAEAKLKELSRTPAYAAALVEITLSQALPVNQRQLAAVSLKNYVDKNWSEQEDGEKFEGPEPPEEVKALVRNQILNGLSDPQTRIRSAVAYAVSKIAHTDWPEQWPDLLNVLLANLQSGEASRVHGAMRVLAEFMKNDVTDQQFPHVAPILLPELFKIFSNPQTYPPQSRARCASVFRDAVDMLNNVKEEHPDAPTQFLLPLMPGWMSAFQVVLAAPSTRVTEELILRLEVTKTLVRLSHNFPKMLDPYLAGLVEPVWADLSRLRGEYLAESVSGAVVATTGDVDSEGEVTGLDNLLYAYFEFIESAVRRAVMDPFLLGHSEKRKKGKKAAKAVTVAPTRPAALPELVWVVMAYAQITTEQEQAWASDADQYVADEDEESLAFNVRIAAVDLLQEGLFDVHRSDTLQALAQAAQRHFADAQALRAQGRPDWWKAQEAVLLAIGRLAEEIVDEVKEDSTRFDLEGLFQQVVLDSMRAAGHPFLQGRAIWFAAKFCEVLPQQLAAEYLNAAVAGIEPSNPNPVRISAVKAMQSFSEHLDASLLQPLYPAIVNGIATLATTAGEDSLVLLFETLYAVTGEVSEESVKACEAQLIDLAVGIWMKQPGDHLVGGIVTELVSLIASKPSCFDALQTRLLPAVRHAMQQVSNPNNASAIAAAVDLATILAKNAPSPLPAVYVQQVFPDLIQTLDNTDDPSIIQSGQDCLRWLIHKDVNQLAACESASAFVGDLITKLIVKAGDLLSPVLEDLLRAVALKLGSAQTPTFIQNQAQIINFLAGLDVNGRNGLELFVSSWCENYMYFQGFYILKLNAVSMSNLYAAAGTDERLRQIAVKGDAIPDGSGKIITRSKAKLEKHTIVPFPVKAVKLLIWDFGNNWEEVTAKQLAKAALEDESEDIAEDDGDDDEDAGEGWEDVEESPFAPAENYKYLSELIESGIVDLDSTDEDEYDPDLKNDPVYHIAMRSNGISVSSFRQPNPGPVDIEQLVAREKLAIQQEEERQQRIGLGVPKEGNDLFDALGKTLPVIWIADHIVIMDEVAVSPPYTVQMVKAVKGKNASASTLERVRKVVEGERKKLGLS